MNGSVNPLKSGMRVLYYTALFGMFFQLFAYPLYAAVSYFPYGVRSNHYIPFVRPDQFEASAAPYPEEDTEAAQTTAVKEAEKDDEGNISKNLTEEAFEIYSSDKMGIIGYGNQSKSDDPSDNIFHFSIDKKQLAGKDLVLSYEVYGIENASGIARSINEHTATGGFYVQKNTSWKTVKETVVADQLKDGDNHLLFTAFETGGSDYKVRNVKLTAATGKETPSVSFADGSLLYVKDGKGYVKGTVAEASAQLFINDKQVPVRNYEFETVLDSASDLQSLDVRLVKSGKTIYRQQLPVTSKEVSETVAYQYPEQMIPVRQAENGNYGFALADVDLNITKEIYEGADRITVQKLRTIDAAPLGTNIINVTAGTAAYRFLPDGAIFNDQAQLTIKFDDKLLPKGYTANDVKILYFDMEQRRWLSVATDTILPAENKIVGLTNHFTDYIAGIIQAPESPETSSFTPTSISDIKVANPTAGIVQIQPPTANQKGDGTLDFPITVPAGRNGLQPNLSVSYNNNGSSGITGYGWDIPIPYISVDTKYGVPKYDSTKETESYLFNGEELMLVNGSNLYLPHRQSNTINRLSGTATFVPKVEGSFSKIQRIGSSPSTYTWVVWDKSGTKYYYGQTANHRLSSGTNPKNIGKWYLSKVEDKNKNYIEYAYSIKNYGTSTGNLSGGVEMLPWRINYTRHPDVNVGYTTTNLYYTVIFNYSNSSRSDAHFNYRYGFKEVNASKLDYIKVTCDKEIPPDAGYPSIYCDYDVEYRFNYGTGAFGKTLLNSITTRNIQKDDSGNTTASEDYTHTFDYYNEVAGGSLFGEEKNISVEDDIADEKHSVISSTKESYSATEFNIGAGLSPMQNPPAWWPFSYGGTINFAFPSGVSTSSSPTMLLLDIDGDGLDDKVVKVGNDIKYHKNLGGIAFSSQLYNAYNIGDLGLFENQTQTDPVMSLSIIAGSFSASKSQTNGRARTFFTDVNNDGLVDFVKDRIVYFNRIDPNSDRPTFTDNSALTPNRIFKEGAPDPDVSAPLPDLSVGNDLMDVVKVWVAPRAGDVNINGTISKNFVASHNGIRYSVEQSGRTGGLPFWDPGIAIRFKDEVISQIPWNPSNPVLSLPIPVSPYSKSYLIQPTLLVTATKNTSASTHVERGDRIYFRVNSSQIPTELVDVSWDPTVEYTSVPHNPSTYSESFVHGDVLPHPLTIAEPGTYTIGWAGQNVPLNENVDLKIRAYQIKEDPAYPDRKVPLAIGTGNNPSYNSVEIYNATLNGASGSLPGVTLPINASGVDTENPDTYIYVEVEAGAKFSLEWKDFDQAFIPVLRKTSVSPNVSTYVVPHYDMRENALTAYPGLSFPFPWPVKIKHDFQLAQCQNFDGVCREQYIYMIARYENGQPLHTDNGMQAKFRYRINPEGFVEEVRQFEGENFESSPIIGDPFSEMQVEPGRELFVEYTTDEYVVASILNHYQNNNDDLISTTAMGFASGGSASPATGASPMGVPLPSGLVRANIATEMAPALGMGTLYKNWGQFAYKGAAPDENFTPIDERYASRAAIAGVSDLSKFENPTQGERDNAEALMNLDPADMDYDEDEGTITAGGNPIPVTPGQMEAIRHFTMLVPDRAMEAWSSHERLYVREGEMSPYLRYYNENYNPMLPIPAPTGIGQYGAFSIVKENTSESKSKGSSINFYGVGFGTTTSNAVSRQLNDFRDVNGDGYPDILGDKIQLTSYRGGLTSTILNKNLLGTTTSDGSGTTAGGSDAHIVALADPGGNFTKVRIGNSATFSGGLNASGQIFQTSTRPESVLVDLNGDGLPDLVKADNEVEFNDAANFVASTWEGYTEPGLTKTYSPGKSIGFGGGFTEFVDPIVIGQDINAKSSSNLDLSVGFSDSRSATHSEKDFVDFNGDGLPDYISGNSIHFNTGTYHLTGSYNLPRMSESSVTSQGFVINASVLIPITIVPLQIIVKVGGGGGKSWGTNYSEENVSLRDFDGDGYVDIVESASETQVKVRFSKIGRTNMLKMVHNPTGSTIEMDYATNNVISGEGFGPTYKMPFKKWVLSKVTVNDGFRGDGADEQKFAFEYQNGLKDRRERKFLGFGEVKTHQLKGDDNPAIYRTVVQKYLLDDMPSSEIYLPGDHTDSRKYQYIGNLLKEESTYDGTQRLLNKTEYDYAVYSIGVEGSEYYQTEFPIGSFSYTDTSRILPLVKSTVDSVFHYNGNGASPFKADVLKTLFKEYDKYGNVTRYYDDFDGNNVEIRYDEKNTASQYIVNIPILHNVNNGERYSTAETDGVGNIITINRFKNGPTGSDVATTDMEYNSLGQLTKVTQPKPQMSSNNSERMFYEYTYDDTFKLFVTEVTDAYGFTGSTEYDHFGMPLKQTDLNGTEFEYIYDPLRRVTQFKGPYNDEWTIKNEYKKDTATGLLYAVTQHNITDETVTGATQQVLHTSSFADGLGRIIQTKKQLAPEDDPNCTTPGNGYRFATSGLQVYDVFGRVVESFLGQEELDCTGNFITALETYTPLTHTTQEKTTIAYDVRDRVLQNHVHGLNATTEYKYGFEDDGTGNVRAYERVTLPEGNVSVTYKDEKGRVRTTKQIDSGMQLLTQYRYDMLGQLEKVTDAEGKETLYEYDNFGQKTKTTHPDNGITEFTYDLTGKLTASASQNLIAQGQEITYTYNFNQLVNIAYPAFVANGQSYPGYNVDYSYGGVGAPDFAAGRITQVNDLTGRKTFKYGALGEVLEDTRQLTGATGTMEFTTGYRYDSWGRIMEMTYPDGEHLEYGYNSAGQLKSIFSDTENQWYLKDVTYTFFEQPAEITYGNDVVTKNEYDITQRVRAMQLDRPDTTTFMRNVYAYDRNQNITNITNSISQHNVLQMGGTFDKNYTYDGFNRLKNASGTWQGYNEHHDYTLAMEYTNTHGIKNKNQFHDVTSTAFTGESENSYDAVYQYTDTAHPHAVSSIAYTGIGGTTSASSQFTYDANGNMTHYQSSFGSFNDREMIWDQQNRLLAVVDDNARVSHYIYDHAGERTFKAVGTVATVSIGGQDIYSVLDFDQYTLYPSGYMVVEPAKGEYSKHYYINGKRFVSRLENNIDQFAVGTGAKGAYATTAAETTATENTGMDLAGMVGAQNTIYSIETPGNDPDDCQQQLDDIVTQYQNGGATVAHCLNAIQEIIDRYGADSPCEALVEVNQYVCTEVDPNDPGNVPDDPNDPVLSPGEMEAADCLTDLNILIAHFAAQIQNGEGSAFFEWYQCIDACIERNDIVDSQGCWERLTVGNGEWPESCNAFYRDCDCGDQPVISELLKCPALAMIYIDTHLAADLSNACAVLNYVKENFNCVPLPEEPEPDPVTPGDISDDWIDDGGNTDDPDDDYDEYQRKPIWWYHTDHLGSSTYLTDNFGRPSHYYETLPFGEMMVEHNQSKYYKSPYPTTNTGSYDNKYKFNGKELDDATGMYYYGSRYYDPRISIFISVDPLAEKFTGWTPYHYVHNNPVNMIDPTGMEADHIIVNENNEIVGGEMDGDLNIYRGKQDENGNWVKTDEVVGQLVNDYQGFRYNEKGGFEGFAEGAKLHTGNVKGFCSGKGLLTSLNNQFEKEIEGPGGYIAALAQLAVDSRGPSGLGPLKGSGKYDIKNTLFGGNFYDLYQYEDGTYITPRSMGNMLFGANARTIFNNKVNALDKQKYDSKWFYSFFMQKAGGYNTRTNNTQGTGGWPFYGEHQGSGTSIFEGYFKGL